MVKNPFFIFHSFFFHSPFFLLFCFSLSAAAQQTLNIHTTTKGVVSFAFTTNPKMTFPEGEILTVTSDSMTVEFPYSEVERITFDDIPTAVPSITVREDISQVRIYDLSGKLIRQVASDRGTATLDLSPLPPGIYVVNDGKRTYKVSKR
jgi:hypothetical protein